MTYTYNQFIIAVSTAVADKLPLMSVDSATVLTTDYINTIGWNTQTGTLYNNFTTDQTVSTIVDSQINSTVCYNATATISIGFDYYLNLPVSQTPIQIENTLTTAIKNFLATTIHDDTNFTFNNLISVVGTTNQVGYSTPAERVSLYKGTGNVDPQTIALIYSKKHYSNIDATWNVTTTFTDNINGLCVVLKKFTDTTFTVLDTTAAFEYVVVMDRERYNVISGLIRNYP